MQRANIDELPNPFSIDGLSSRRERKPFIKQLKFFGLTGLLLALLLLISHQYSRYRINGLGRNFASLSSAQKLDRLDQLSACGPQAIPAIVNALSDQEDQVAGRAHDLLRRLQDDWTVLELDQTIQCQTRLVQTITDGGSALSGNRKQLAIDLLQQAAHLSVQQNDDATRQLYFAATAAIDQLSPSQSANTASQSNAAARQIDERQRPLPVAHLAHAVDWTDWPPPNHDALSPQPTTPGSSAEGNITEPNMSPANTPLARPTIHQTSKSPLQAVADDEVVVLRQLTPDRTHAVEREASGPPLYDPPAKLQPVAHVIETSWQEADLATIIKSLSLPNQDLQHQATTELSRRGLSEVEISIATRIAGGETANKIALIESISKTPAIDPRPWLMLLVDDSNREVRLRSISALAALKDPWVKQQLKLRMVDEKDQTVAFRIRRVLNLR